MEWRPAASGTVTSRVLCSAAVSRVRPWWATLLTGSRSKLTASTVELRPSGPSPQSGLIVLWFVGSTTREKCYIRGFRGCWREAVVLRCVLVSAS